MLQCRMLLRFWQQCRSNVWLCCQKRQQCRTRFALKFRPFDKVNVVSTLLPKTATLSKQQASCLLLRQCCFDIVASVDRALETHLTCLSSIGMERRSAKKRGGKWSIMIWTNFGAWRFVICVWPFGCCHYTLVIVVIRSVLLAFLAVFVQGQRTTELSSAANDVCKLIKNYEYIFILFVADLFLLFLFFIFRFLY